MSINNSIISSKSFRELQQTVDSIRNNQNIHTVGKTEVEVGTEVVNISSIQQKLLQLYESGKASANGMQKSDYEDLASLLFHIKEPDTSDTNIKKIYRNLFISDPRIRKIRTECAQKLQDFDKKETVAHSHSTPKPLKISHCRTIQSLQKLLLSMIEAQQQEPFHRQKNVIPYEEFEQNLYNLYIKEMEQTPHLAVDISLKTSTMIHLLKVMKPRSSKEKRAIDVLEKKCIQTIQQDKNQLEIIRNRYNTIAEKWNTALLAAYGYNKKGSSYTPVAIDRLEITLLAKILGGEIGKYAVYEHTGEPRLIELMVDANNPEERQKCFEMYRFAAGVWNQQNELRLKLKELNLLTKRLEIASAIQLSQETVEATKNKITELKDWLINQDAQTRTLLLGDVEDLLAHEKIPKLALSESFSVKLRSICRSYANILGIPLTLKQQWGKEPYGDINDIPVNSVNSSSNTPEAPSESTKATINCNFVTAQAEATIEATLKILDEETLFGMYCTQFVSMDIDIPAANLTGTGLLNLQEHTSAINRQICSGLLEHVNRRFNTTEKVFKFVNEHYDRLGDMLINNLALREAIFEKLDALIEDEILKEINPSITEKIGSKVPKFLSRLGFGKKSEWAQSIRDHLEESFYGELSENEFRKYLSSRTTSQKLLRPLTTARKLYTEYLSSLSGEQSQRRWMESVEKFKRYTKILWEARNNPFNDVENVELNAVHTGNEYYKIPFHGFYQYLSNKELQEIFWNTIIENSPNAEDLNRAVDLQRDYLNKSFRLGNISLANLYQSRNEFLKKIPLRKYLEANDYAIKLRVYNPQVNADADIVSAAVLLFIQSVKNNEVENMVYATLLLNAIGPNDILSYTQTVKQWGLLSDEEMQIFDNNYQMPLKEPVKTPEPIAKDPQTELADRLNQLGAPMNSSSDSVDESDWELMENLEELKFLENVRKRLNALYDEIEPTPESMIAELEQLPPPPSDAPYDTWFELNKRMEALTRMRVGNFG